MNVCRWGDNDRYIGPLTFAADRKYRHLALVAFSGDDEGSSAGFRVSGFGGTAILALPRWLIPTEKTKAFLHQSTIERLGRNWYLAQTRREYGVSIHGGLLSLMWGRQTCDSSTEQRKGWFLPWTQWRFVRHSLYGLDGAHFGTLPRHDGRLGAPYFGELERLKASCPTAEFAFTDFDGEALTVTTKIEEREWLFGEGWFKWLSLFRSPKVRRSLDLRFSDETGKRKGSWKGGTIGCSIDMLPGELHASVFKRYCEKNDMRFRGS